MFEIIDFKVDEGSPTLTASRMSVYAPDTGIIVRFKLSSGFVLCEVITVLVSDLSLAQVRFYGRARVLVTAMCVYTCVYIYIYIYIYNYIILYYIYIYICI